MTATNTVEAIVTPENESHVPGGIKDDVIDTSAASGRHSQRAKVGRVAHNAATQILLIVQAAAEAVPMIGPPLKVVIGGLLKTLNALAVGIYFFRLQPYSNRKI
jgi:hypothetical protein